MSSAPTIREAVVLLNNALLDARDAGSSVTIEIINNKGNVVTKMNETNRLSVVIK